MTTLDFGAMPPADCYRWLTALVTPRPIAWVCSRSADGLPNLAPHSFFTVACVDPPVVQFTSVGRKDSLRNAEAAARVYAGVQEPLTADDVAEVCAFAVNLPHHVNLDRITIRPVAQPSQFKVIRKES